MANIELSSVVDDSWRTPGQDFPLPEGVRLAKKLGDPVVVVDQLSKSMIYRQICGCAHVRAFRLPDFWT